MLCDVASPNFTGVMEAICALSKIARKEQEEEHETPVLENSRRDFVALVGVHARKLYTL